MKHQYSTNGFLKRSLQLITDFVVDLFMKFHKKNFSGNYAEPQKILFVSLGHLGDILILSYIFPLIKTRFPHAQLDILAGEWCQPLLKNNPYINNTIFYNHSRLNRANIPIWKKITLQRKSSVNALKIITSQKYNLSIEGRISHPNGNLICYRGKIERRIGFGSGGFGSLLTDEIPFPQKKNFHMLEAILEEIKKVGINTSLSVIRPYYFLPEESIEKKHPFFTYFNDTYIILHAETGKKDGLNRKIKKEFWLKIVQIILKDTNYKIVVCGTSKRSQELFEYFILNITESEERIINAIQKLTIDEFCVISKYAKVALTLDSFAAHMCAINCNTISFYKNCIGTLFFPISNKKAIVIHNNRSIEETKAHPNVCNYYVEDLESKDTFKIIEKYFADLNQCEKNFIN
jgi:heptosyltransferase-3